MRFCFNRLAIGLALARALGQPALAALPATPAPPVVLGAASLAEALNAAADAWAKAGHQRPTIVLAASSALARQVEAGAPGDIFLSADEQWMDELAGKGLIRASTRRDLLTNTLVLVAPEASTLRMAIVPGFPLARALGEGRLATGEVDSVPAGIYAKQALQKLGVWPSVSGRIAGAANVRAALLLVEHGEAPLGIVYATDAQADHRVHVVGVFPESSHPPILYPVARLARSASPDAAGFLAFLESPAGKAMFLARGFGVR